MSADVFKYWSLWLLKAKRHGRETSWWPKSNEKGCFAFKNCFIKWSWILLLTTLSNVLLFFSLLPEVEPGMSVISLGVPIFPCFPSSCCVHLDLCCSQLVDLSWPADSNWPATAKCWKSIMTAMWRSCFMIVPNNMRKIDSVFVFLFLFSYNSSLLLLTNIAFCDAFTLEKENTNSSFLVDREPWLWISRWVWLTINPGNVQLIQRVVL